ncbi:MAG: YdeI/OmpD-associated family protein [Bacillota bacterium]|nr:YdeI/OmpD-associated family protein [Bacillota bacterium]
MNQAEIFYTSDRKSWRRWLAENFQSKTEVWFVFPMKDSGEPCLSYNDAVEEALCFGWIDSTIKHIDPLHRIQRFTPRRKGSPYSRPNIERLIWLDSRGMIQPEVRKSVADLIETEYIFPEDILAVIKADDAAWENFRSFSNSYNRIRIAYIDAARTRPEEFEKRLKNFVSKTRDGKLIKGFGGVEKYYK